MWCIPCHRCSWYGVQVRRQRESSSIWWTERMIELDYHACTTGITIRRQTSREIDFRFVVKHRCTERSRPNLTNILYCTAISQDNLQIRRCVVNWHIVTADVRNSCAVCSEIRKAFILYETRKQRTSFITKSRDEWGQMTFTFLSQSTNIKRHNEHLYATRRDKQKNTVLSSLI